jgi:hypothetical protein
MNIKHHPLSALLALPLTLAACDGDDPGAAPTAGALPAGTSAGVEVSADPGALISVRMESRVGFLLDELPEGARDAAAAALLERDEQLWRARAQRQIETTLYRLVYRNFFYDEEEGRGQLPLPPRELWSIELGAPQREMIDGHDLVTITYTLTSTLLTGYEEAALAEPALSAVGGRWSEPFVLPADPDLLLERTGYACMDEADFPPNSVDTENAVAFYDHECVGGEGEDSCHVTQPAPQISCVDALQAYVGRVETTVDFERLAWDEAIAAQVRVGEQRPGIHLKALSEGVEDNRIVYRYFPEDSCAIAEGCVGGAGWRRLLQFTATVQNLGDRDSAIGDVSETSAAVQNRLVSLSACHQHMHFNHYGAFTYGEGELNLGSKRAFCLESTARYFNNEDTPLTHPYGCHFQGTAAGWGDDYIAGLDCQWVDITPVEPGTRAPLGFHVNPDGFLCEGEPRLNEAGELTFEETEFLNEAGERESKISCDVAEGWESDNKVSVEVVVPEGGLVTDPCERGTMGDKRACGFSLEGDVRVCVPGERVELSCVGGEVAMAVRVCEASASLGAIPCLWREALVSEVVGGEVRSVSFTCPEGRDVVEVGGRYSLYVSPLVDGAVGGAVRCD